MNWLTAIWDGIRLTCPNCRRGRIYRSVSKMNERCPNCGVVFERDEGEFVGAIVMAYSFTAVLVAIGVFILGWIADPTLTVQIVTWSVFSTLFLVLFYRNFKGLWLGIVHSLIGLFKD